MKNKPLDIIFEDDHLMVVNKPAGIHSARLPASGGGLSLAEKLCEYLPELREAGDSPTDCGLVNRLDYETSGCILVAKTTSVLNTLRSDLKAERIKKTYLALVGGRAPASQTIENFIGTPYRRAKKVKVYTSKPPKRERALPARSKFELVKYVAEKDVSLVRAAIRRARRHQVRAHAKFMGHPLVGDLLYGATRGLSEITEKDNLPVFFLHAESVSFKHPVSGRSLILSVKPDRYGF